MFWYFALLLGFASLRVIELVVSRQHQSRLLAEGGRRITESTYPLMVAVHTGLFLGSAAEVWWLKRTFPSVGLDDGSFAGPVLGGTYLGLAEPR